MKLGKTQYPSKYSITCEFWRPINRYRRNYIMQLLDKEEYGVIIRVGTSTDRRNPIIALTLKNNKILYYTKLFGYLWAKTVK
jgi:hypothetical protein